MTEKDPDLAPMEAFDRLPAPLRKAFQDRQQTKTESEVLRQFQKLEKGRGQAQAVQEVLSWMDAPTVEEGEPPVQYTQGTYRPGNARPRQRQLRTLKP